MDWYYWIIGNRELFKIFYAIVIVLTCVFIVIKTNRLFQISLHQGIRYFRNAFFFYGVGFTIRYLVGGLFVFGFLSSEYNFLIIILFEYFLIMGGFFLLYSLLWKRIERPGERHMSSLFNSRMLLFYIFAMILVVLDYLWQTYYFMFFSQVFLFSCASVVSYLNYKKKGERHRFLKFYLVAMVLSLIAWILNAIAALYLGWNEVVLIGIYTINMIIFLLFLYGIVKIIRK